MAVMSKIKVLNVAATADGANTIITAVSGAKLRVYGYHLMGTAAGIARALDGTAVGAGTLSGFSFGANGDARFQGNYPRGPWAFETGVGNALVLSNATGQDILGHVSYCEV